MTAATNPLNGTGQLVATEEVAERDALILRLLTSGHSCQQVVDMRLPGIANKGAVSKARKCALDAIRAPAVAEYRAEQLAEPRKSMSLQATVELDSEDEALQAQLTEAYSASLAEKTPSLPTCGRS